jgi:hypothetical protein
MLILACLAANAESPSLKSMYDQHRWFELRDAINNKEAPMEEEWASSWFLRISGSSGEAMWLSNHG